MATELVPGAADRPSGLEATRSPNPELIAQGWERRFITDGRRLNEYITLYESLGYEVLTERVQAEEIGPECNDCRLVVLLQFHTVYTRKRP